MEFDEKKAILECRNGDLGQFTLLYDAYVKKIYNYIYFKILNKGIAQDLTSDVFFKALKNIKSFDSKKRFSPWIYEIARNTLIDYFRTRKITTNIDDIWDLKEDSDLLQNIDNKICYERVRSHLSELTSIQRDIITMRVWQDMSYCEISDALGITEQNCRVIFSRSITKLRDLMPLSILIILILNI